MWYAAPAEASSVSLMGFKCVAVKLERYQSGNGDAFDTYRRHVKDMLCCTWFAYVCLQCVVCEIIHQSKYTIRERH